MAPSLTALLSMMVYALACLTLLTTTSALNLSFKRAPRGASLVSPWRPSRYSFSQADTTNGTSDNGIGNVNNIRV